MKEKVLFVFKGNLEPLVRDTQEGKAPDEFLYGMRYLDAARYEVGYIHDPKPFAKPSAWIFKPFQKWFARRFSIGFNFHNYWANRKDVQSADYIVATVDGYGLPILWQKSRGRIPGKLVYISQGLFSLSNFCDNNWLNNTIRKRIGHWLRSADAIITLGEGDAKAIQETFKDCAVLKPQTLLFGIDENFWTPGSASPGDPFVLSVGSDMLRDYPLLLKSIGEYSLRIVTRLKLDAASTGPNVKVNGNIDWAELRTLYRQAAFVVSPIQNQRRDSGHSATLQAMACGKAVILSDTQGLWDRARMRHGETCFLVKSGDVPAMQAAIRYLWEHPEVANRIGQNARKLVEDAYSSRQYGRALENCLHALNGSDHI